MKVIEVKYEVVNGYYMVDDGNIFSKYYDMYVHYKGNKNPLGKVKLINKNLQK